MSKNKKIFYILLIFIFFLGGFLRFWHLNKIPDGVWYDEAYNGLDALTASENNNYQIFYPENYGREGLFINILALSFKIFGVNNFALRLPSAIFGFLTIIGFFFLLKSFKFKKTTIILGTFALGVSFYHLNFSRIAFRAIMVPLLLIWSFYFFIKGYQKIKQKIFTLKKENINKVDKTTKKNKTFLINKKYLTRTFHLLYNDGLLAFFMAGLLTGLGLHTYIAYRLVPLTLLMILIIFLLAEKKFLKHYWRAIIVFLIGAIVTSLPLLLYFQQHPSAFSGRTNAVSIFNNNLQLNPLMAFLKSITIHIQSLIFIGDHNQRHNYNSFPLLPAVWSLFFLIGFIISFKEIIITIYHRFKNKPPTNLFLASLLSQSIFWTMLLPGALSLEGIPHFLRIIGITPAVFIMIVLPFEYLQRLYQHLKQSPTYRLKIWRWRIVRLSLIGLILSFIFTGLTQPYLYFTLWAYSPQTNIAFQQDLYTFGKFIKKQPLKKQNYLLLHNNINIDKKNRHNFSEKTIIFSAYPEIKKYQAYNINEDLTALLINNSRLDCSNSQFILQPNTPPLILKKIQNYCRNLKLQKITEDNSSSSFETWILK